jgi:formamidopyrimidine-DNA glycosylase
MPELPEVQTTVNGLNQCVTGQKITDVWTSYDSPFHKSKENIKNPLYFKRFKQDVIGSKIVSASRRAKNILVHLNNNKTILVHMKMTGHILYGKYGFHDKKWLATEDEALKDPFNQYIRLVFSLSDGKQLALSDMRKFAKVTLLDTETLFESEHLFGAGPEPLEPAFTLPVFKERIMKRPNGKIKTVLIDQTLIAGIGNIYSDEILWRAGVHPEERVHNIDDVTLKKMYTAVKATLKKGIDFGGDSMSDYRNIFGERGKFQEQHNAYRRTGKPCKKPSCKGVITRKVVGGRSAHFCSIHQKLSKIEAKK